MRLEGILWNILAATAVHLTLTLVPGAETRPANSDLLDKLVQSVDAQLEAKFAIINQLTELRKSIVSTLANSKATKAPIVDTSAPDDPVRAFVEAHRQVQLLDQVRQQISASHPQQTAASIRALLEDTLASDHQVPDEKRLAELAESLIRLQIFYKLNATALFQGKIVPNGLEGDHEGQPTVMMSAEDCFMVGAVAYDGARFLVAVDWLQRALDLEIELELQRQSAEIFDTASQDKISSILDYLAFAAYKCGMLNQSITLTELWLMREPSNERALYNLDHFRLESSSVGPGEEGSTVEAGDLVDYYQSEWKVDIDDYELTRDRLVQELCADYLQYSPDRSKSCHRRHLITDYHRSPEVRVEVLSSNPSIIRVHDIISDQEAEYLQKVAEPGLKRSTVQTSSGLATTDFRLAETAWLSSRSDPVIQRVELRLAHILNISIAGSEDLQVVHYGLGGFYGPHLDTARPAMEPNVTSPRQSQYTGIATGRYDRLATVLIYLNQVEAGGATVFPRLKLAVKPIKNSAVFWYNVLDNGFADPRTLHTGCPILIGSKWIATKWPREAPNRPSS